LPFTIASMETGTVLASGAPITFPALLFYLDGHYSDAVPRRDNLRQARGGQMNDFLGKELVDSAGQRFRIFRFVGLEERVELRRKRRWFDFGDDGRIFCFDLELEPLPPTTFQDIHRRVMANEAALDALPHRRGRRARTQQDKQRLEQCQSIDEIITALSFIEVGAPSDTS